MWFESPKLRTNVRGSCNKRNILRSSPLWVFHTRFSFRMASPVESSRLAPSIFSAPYVPVRVGAKSQPQSAPWTWVVQPTSVWCRGPRAFWRRVGAFRTRRWALAVSDYTLIHTSSPHSWSHHSTIATGVSSTSGQKKGREGEASDPTLTQRVKGGCRVGKGSKVPPYLEGCACLALAFLQRVRKPFCPGSLSVAAEIQNPFRLTLGWGSARGSTRIPIPKTLTETCFCWPGWCRAWRCCA